MGSFPETYNNPLFLLLLLVVVVVVVVVVVGRRRGEVGESSLSKFKGAVNLINLYIYLTSL